MFFKQSRNLPGCHYYSNVFMLLVTSKCFAIRKLWYAATVQLVIFMNLIFHGSGSSDDFIGLYFRGVPTLITYLYS